MATKLSVDDKIKMMTSDGKNKEVMQRLAEEQEIDKKIEALTIKKDDVILLKGEWDEYSISHIANRMNSANHQCMLIVLPENLSFETMPLPEFHKILKETEKLIDPSMVDDNILQESIKDEGDGVCGD